MATTLAPPPPVRQPWAREDTPVAAATPRPAGRPPTAGTGTATTRYLCAAVTLDPALERKAIDDVLEEEHRAVVTTPGVDLVTVLKYALAAHRRRLVRDAVLLADLLAMILTIFFLRSGIVFLLLVVAAWVAVFTERYTSRYGSVIRGLQPGAFAPQNARSPAPNSFADRQLKRIAAASTAGNVTVYSRFPPFVGYGRLETSWSFAIDVTRPRRGGRPRAFSVQEVYDHVKGGLYELDLPGVDVTDRLFVNGRDIKDDPRFLRTPGNPVTAVSPDMVRQLMATPEERARPYLAIGMTGWQGDLVVTTFIRFLLSRTDLFVEAAHTAVPPLREEFKVIDRRDPAPTPGEFFRLVGSSLLATLPMLLGSVAAFVHELGADNRREKKRRHVEETGDYGALLSLREEAADSRWQRYFQVFDDARYVKVIEQRIFRSLLEFLEARDIDTSSLSARTEMVINNGVMVTDRSTVHADQIAGGAGAQAAGLISRIRPKESPANADGGS